MRLEKQPTLVTHRRPAARIHAARSEILSLACGGLQCHLLWCNAFMRFSSFLSFRDHFLGLAAMQGIRIANLVDAESLVPEFTHFGTREGTRQGRLLDRLMIGDGEIRAFSICGPIASH